MSLLLSICILTYNRKQTLCEALDSILPQVADRQDVEVFVSDNASTDGTGEAIRPYCQRHPRLRYLRKPDNTGFDGNVVSCLENAAGEYTAFFSDDDIAPADYVARLIAGLVESHPVVAYVNHTPFFEDNPAKIGAPTQPVLKRLFTDPTEFFLYTGLGFITAVILQTTEARKHIPKAVMGRGTAFIDISSRCVLTTSGPFLFDGTVTVLARHEENSWYDALSYGPMVYTQALLDLLRDGLLTDADIAWHNRKTIRLFLPRCIVNNRLKARKIVPARELRKLYGTEPIFYLFAYPLALIPAPLLRMIAIPARALMRMRRKSLLKSAKPMRQATHLAPP
jgi:glycosyltransferase involved in cell wall biosynthesis